MLSHALREITVKYLSSLLELHFYGCGNLYVCVHVPVYIGSTALKS